MEHHFLLTHRNAELFHLWLLRFLKTSNTPKYFSIQIAWEIIFVRLFNFIFNFNFSQLTFGVVELFCICYSPWESTLSKNKKKQKRAISKESQLLIHPNLAYLKVYFLLSNWFLIHKKMEFIFELHIIIIIDWQKTYLWGWWQKNNLIDIPQAKSYSIHS